VRRGRAAPRAADPGEAIAGRVVIVVLDHLAAGVTILDSGQLSTRVVVERPRGHSFASAS
jgi:hypothetical protein